LAFAGVAGSDRRARRGDERDHLCRPQAGQGNRWNETAEEGTVTGAKVKDHSLTGKDISLAKLGTVASASSAGHAVSADDAAHATSAGSAAHAISADSANGIAPPEPIHIVGAPGEPQFMSGSTNHPAPGSGASYPLVGFYKDREGIVHLEGVVGAGKEGPTRD
jgi:hypothetical protein